MEINKVYAILSLLPNAKFLMQDGQITEWNDDRTQPTEQEITDEIARLQADYDAQEYARSRKGEYPSIGDQLDALFHAGVFPEDMAATIQAVKDKYPKEAE